MAPALTLLSAWSAPSASSQTGLRLLSAMKLRTSPWLEAGSSEGPHDDKEGGRPTRKEDAVQALPEVSNGEFLE